MPSNPSIPLATHAAAARHGHRVLQAQFEHALAALAEACANGNTLDPQKLDQQQQACYALAFAAAELLALDAVLSGSGESELDLHLALVGAGEAIPAVVAHLETICLALGIRGLTPVGVLNTDGLRLLRRAALAPAALARITEALTHGNAEIGRVSLDPALLTAQDQFRHLATKAIVPLAGEIHRHDLTVPETILEPLRAMGAFGLSIPETYGGSAPADGSGNLMMIAVTETLSEASLGAAGSLITRPEILSRALLAGGTEAQKSRWLPAIAAGNPLCAISITEPDFGSDVASLGLRATKVDGGWRLNGTKTWCTFAGKAGLLMVVARTTLDSVAGHRGLSLFLVEKPSYDSHTFQFRQDTGGLLTGHAIPTIGYRGMHSFDLALDNVFVPDANLVGGENGLGKGFYFTMAGMTGGRLQTAARALGVMRGALRSAIQYASERRVFGKPLIEHQLTQVRIATMAARLASCRQLTYAVGRLMDQGQGHMEASLVKLFACRTAEQITRDAMQLFGGMGYAEETAISRHFVDARVLSIFEGSEETLALKVVARSLLEDSIRAD